MKMTKATAKVAAVATGLAMATSMLSLAPIAHAATLTTAQVSSILSLLSSFGANSATIANVNAALTGTTVTSGSTTTTSGASSCSFSRNLTIGSTGADVTCLQSALIAGGFSIPAGATGYFGTQTRTAVASWQSSRNVAPAVGYFGAISRAAWNLGGTSSSSSTTTTTTTTTSTVAGCAPGALFSATTAQACGSTTTTTTGALTGSGRLTNISSLGDVVSDIKEGAAATQVAGFSADATGGDVAVQRVDATFLIGGSGSSNLDAYVSDVSLWFNGTKIANMDPSLGDKTTRTWVLRFSGLNGVIRSGQTGNFYVKVTPLTSISSTNFAATAVSFGTASIRAVGADGISDTYDSTATGSFTVTAATAGTLTVTAASDNPISSQVAVGSTTTSGVNLLSFGLKAKNSAVTITDLGASISVTGVSNTVANTVSQVKLMKGSTVIKTGTITAGATPYTYSNVVFSGVDQTIAKDATANYWISVDLKADALYPDGSTIVASTTGGTWDVSDANGNTVTITTSAVGNAQTLTATGISVVRGTPTASVSNGLAGADDIATFTIPFTVTAGDADVYIGSAAPVKQALATAAPASAGVVNFATTTSSTRGATQEPVGIYLSAANVVSGDNSGTSFKVLAGTSRTFTFGATILASSTVNNTDSHSSGVVGLILTGIAYGPTNSGSGSFYTSGLDSYKTADVFVTKR